MIGYEPNLRALGAGFFARPWGELGAKLDNDVYAPIVACKIARQVRDWRELSSIAHGRHRRAARYLADHLANAVTRIKLC